MENTAGALDLSVSTGDVYLTDTTCKSVTSSGNTGDITLEHVAAAEKFTIERNTGDVRFISSDAADIFVETDTGYVAGNLLTGKAFIVQSHTGNISVPDSIAGDRCEIITKTGNIEITIG